MTASIAQSAAPSWAVKVWADDLCVYAEVPSLNAPCVVSAAFSEGGLSKILAILSAKHQQEAAGEQYLPPRAVAKRLMKEGITQRDMDAASKVLEQLNFLKPKVARR
jgi:hypothetical protein